MLPSRLRCSEKYSEKIATHGQGPSKRKRRKEIGTLLTGVGGAARDLGSNNNGAESEKIDLGTTFGKALATDGQRR